MLTASLLMTALYCFRANAMPPTLSVELDDNKWTQTVDDSGDPVPAFDYGSIVRDIPRYAQIAKRESYSLEGRMTPSGLGRYPKGVTGYGSQVWECGGPWWATEHSAGSGADDGICKPTKVTPGVCYKSLYPQEAEKTFVPDRELTCSVFMNAECSWEPKFSDAKALDAISAFSAAERKRFANRTMGYVSGIRWPGVESFQTNWGIYWRVNVGVLAPGSYLCYRNGIEAGIGKDF